MITIRQAEKRDIEEIYKIVGIAVKFMRDHGNDAQWTNTEGIERKIASDIEKGQGFVVTDDDRVCAYFAFIIGPDPTYSYIEGSWPDDEEYGTIHRVASDGTVHGIMDHVLDFASSRINNIRIDTHELNSTMRKKVTDKGFTYAGIIYVDDGTPRVAYWKKY
ncbi:MAG: N-acetyltransferase [Eubacteriales bacterium]|nr:N-acetyltransferase [Eubacteriales bacterium]